MHPTGKGNEHVLQWGKAVEHGGAEFISLSPHPFNRD